MILGVIVMGSNENGGIQLYRVSFNGLDYCSFFK